MKIVAIANAHALAHVSRLLEVAKVLRTRGHKIVFAGEGKYLEVAGRDGFSTRRLPYVSVEQVVRAVRSQRLWQLYPKAQISEYLDAEQRFLEEVRPDLVLIDNRPTARTSAERLGIRTAALLNVHMSNYRRTPFFSVTNLPGLQHVPGLEQLDRIENAIECTMYDRLVMRGLNQIRHELGLKRLHAYEHEEGELTLLTDVPEFNPVRMLPAHAHFIGPLTWHNDLPAPRCLTQLESGKPVVYLSLGSEGLEDLLSHLDLFARDGFQVVVATGTPVTMDTRALPPGVFLEQYVNTDALLPHCDLVCCHGGNGTLYQALGFGVPVVVVATHQEQAYGGKRIRRLGLGSTMMLNEVRQRGFARVLRELRVVLADPAYRSRAVEFSAHLRRWNGAQTAANLIERHINAPDRH